MVGFKSYIPTGTFSKAQFQMLLKMQKKKKEKKRQRVDIVFLPYISNTQQWQRSFSME